MQFSDKNKKKLTDLAKIECHDATFHEQAPPLVLAKASGSFVWDIDGNKYIDLCSGFASLPLGHNHQVVMDVMQEYKQDIPPILHGLGDVHPSEAKVDFLAFLKELLPQELSKGAFSVTGGQAVEFAVKTAILSTRRNRFLVFHEGYHGLDLGILPMTSREDFRAPFSTSIKSENVTTLPFHVDPHIIAQEIESTIGTHQAYAGVILEPVQGRGGIRQFQGQWLREVRNICDHYGVLLIYDEILTGMGRTGCITHWDEAPCDIVCLGKSIGGGMPLSACFAKPDIMDSWPKSKGEAIHTGTFFGHALACRIGMATLKEVMKENLLARSLTYGNTIMEKLRDRILPLSGVKEVRGKGMMIGVEFTQAFFAARLMDQLRKNGILAIPCGHQARTLSITPALNISSNTVDEALEKVKLSIEQIS